MSTEDHLVSVILPSYNSADWLNTAIYSVLAQSHKKLELLVIDDGSTDTTATLLTAIEQSDTRVKVVKRSKCSGGPATPRNEGVQHAKGSYLAFIDADDLWHPQKLELQLIAMKANNLNFLSSQHTPFRSTPPESCVIDEPPRVKIKDQQKLIRKNWIVTSSALIETSLFKQTRFNPNSEYVGVEDYVAWLELHQNPTIRSGVLILPLVFYRLRNDSLSASKLMMAKKIYYLLSHHSINGKALGIKKYYYFLSYALSSIASRIR